MKIGLIDVDSKMINLALMKLSTYHKNYEDDVEWYSPLRGKYDRIYMSKIFNFTSDYKYELNTGDIVVKGGTGYDIKTHLPDSVEQCNPDYSIYPNCNYSIQLFSRGCIRKCKFCIVNEKEGHIKPVKPMKLNSKGKYIEILDNNFFANPNWNEAINNIMKFNLPVNITQGIDVRLINEEQCFYLNKLKHRKQIHIAWDNIKDNILDKIKIMTKYIKVYKLMCYVLIGYNSTHDENYYRIMKLKELKIDPFVMPYDKNNDYQKRFARWVNHKAIFKTVEWKNYNKKEYNKKEYNKNILEYV